MRNRICNYCYTINGPIDQICNKCKQGVNCQIDAYAEYGSPIDLVLHRHPVRQTIFTEKGWCKLPEIPSNAVRVIGEEYTLRISGLIPVLPFKLIERENDYLIEFTQRITDNLIDNGVSSKPSYDRIVKCLTSVNG